MPNTDATITTGTLSNHIHEGTVLAPSIKLAKGLAKGIPVEFLFLKEGKEVKSFKAALDGQNVATCEAYTAPDVAATEVKYELAIYMKADAEVIGVRSFFVWPKSGKLTSVNHKDGKPLAGFKFIVKQNNAQIGDEYATVKTGAGADDPAECPYFRLEAGNPFVIEARSPFELKEYVKPATADPQPHHRVLEIKGDKKPYKRLLVTPAGAEELPGEASRVYSTDDPTGRGTGLLGVTIQASDRSLVVDGDEVHVEVECKRRSARTYKAPDVPGLKPVADWADGTDPYTKTRKWTGALKLADGLAKFDINLGVAGGDEFIIQVGGSSGVWDHKAFLVTWRKLQVAVLRGDSALSSYFGADDSKVLDEGDKKGVWETAAAAFLPGYVHLVAHAGSKRFTQGELEALKTVPATRSYTMPGKDLRHSDDAAPDQLVISASNIATIFKSWRASGKGVVTLLIADWFGDQSLESLMRQPESAATKYPLPKPKFLYMTKLLHDPEKPAFNPGFMVTVTKFKADPDAEAASVQAFEVTNPLELMTIDGGDAKLDLSKAKVKRIARDNPRQGDAGTGSEIVGFFKDNAGVLESGVELADFKLPAKKTLAKPLPVGSKLKVKVDGVLHHLLQNLGGQAYDGTDFMVNLMITSSITNTPPTKPGIGGLLVHEIGHLLGLAYVNPSTAKPEEDGTAQTYITNMAARQNDPGVAYAKIHTEQDGTAYWARSGLGAHCSKGIDSNQKAKALWGPKHLGADAFASNDPWPTCIMFGWGHPNPAKVEFCPDCVRVVREADVLESRGVLK